MTQAQLQEFAQVDVALPWRKFTTLIFRADNSVESRTMGLVSLLPTNNLPYSSRKTVLVSIAGKYLYGRVLVMDRRRRDDLLGEVYGRVIAASVVHLRTPPAEYTCASGLRLLLAVPG